MLRKIEGCLEGPFPKSAAYYRGKGWRARFIMPFTKWLRTKEVMALMEPRNRHLDISCGDGHLLKLSPCRDCWGLDLIYGDHFDKTLDFPGDFFDYVTMLAVLEHLLHPIQVFREIHRVLKPGGKFIFTTPKAQAEWLIRLYAKEDDLNHHYYYDRDTVLELSQGLFHLEAAQTFLLGVNQIFSLSKMKLSPA